MSWRTWSYSSETSGNPRSSRKTFCRRFLRFGFGVTRIGAFSFELAASREDLRHDGLRRDDRMQYALDLSHK